MVELNLLYRKNWSNSLYKNQLALYNGTTCDIESSSNNRKKPHNKKVLGDNRTAPMYTKLPQYINKEISTSSHMPDNAAIQLDAMVYIYSLLSSLTDLFPDACEESRKDHQ